MQGSLKRSLAIRNPINDWVSHWFINILIPGKQDSCVKLMTIAVSLNCQGETIRS